MQPANTASASEIEGRSGSRAVVVGMSWVRSREMAPFPSVIPAFKLNPRPHSEATSFVGQRTLHTSPHPYGCIRNGMTGFKSQYGWYCLSLYVGMYVRLYSEVEPREIAIYISSIQHLSSLCPRNHWELLGRTYCMQGGDHRSAKSRILHSCWHCIPCSNLAIVPRVSSTLCMCRLKRRQADRLTRDHRHLRH